MTPRAAWIFAATVALVALSGCNDAAPPAAPARSELAELAKQAEAFASRAEAVIERPWSSRIEFPKRLHVRIEAARAFARDAAAAGAAADGTLVQRGRALALTNRPFESALALVDRLTSTIEQIFGYQRLLEANIKALETEGEAPFRIRVDDLGRDAALGFKHLDEALSHVVVNAPDAETHDRIATGTMRRVLETATKLSDEVKTASFHAVGATSREELLGRRLAWADAVVAKAGDAVTPEARAALETARRFATTDLPPRRTMALDKLRNAQPDATSFSEALAKDADAVLERLTKEFLDLGRKAGIPDPK